MTSTPTTQTVPREYPPVPLVGVAAAVFNRHGQVLLVQRGRTPARGSWGLPGGLLEVGESVREGIRRELREECGVEIAVGHLVGIFEPLERDAEGRVRYHYVVLDYWAGYVSGEPVAQDDAAAAAWVSLDGLDRLPMVPETRAVIRDAHRAWREAGAVAAG